MKIQERTPSYRRRTYGGLDDQYEGGLKQTFAAQVLICILILMFCVLVKLYPGENFEKAKNSVQLIVTQNTDIKAEFEKLKAIIADVLNLDENDIHMDSTFVDDLGADSLDVFQIIMGIEEEFDIEIDNEEAEKITTVQDAVDQIKKAVE